MPPSFTTRISRSISGFRHCGAEPPQAHRDPRVVGRIQKRSVQAREIGLPVSIAVTNRTAEASNLRCEKKSIGNEEHIS
jgi:hypothetical protein